MQSTLRACHEDEAEKILAIINAAAERYRGVIPDDSWHEPYMSDGAFRSELAAGIRFVGCEIGGALAGVMGIQSVRSVDLIRHAYVSPAHQGHGIGSALIAHLRERTARPILIGTWAAASWAIRFYERHGFRLAPEPERALLLRTFWTIPERQSEASVVLAFPALTSADARRLVMQG